MELSWLDNKYLQDTKFWEEENKVSGRAKIVIGVSINYARLLSLVFEFQDQPPAWYWAHSARQNMG